MIKKKLSILVAGGSGFIGSSIAVYLKKNVKNINIITVDNISRKTSRINLHKLKKNKIKNYKFDLSLNSLNNIKKKFDFIIDCCAEPSVETGKFNVDLVFNSNLKSTLNILKKAQKDKSKVIYLSSSRVYSIDKINNLFKNKNFNLKLRKKIKINENFPTVSPITLYGFTKLSSEMLIREYSYLYKIKYIINRLGVVSGYGQFGKQDQGFISMWIWRHLNMRPITYQGYGGFGNQIRDVLNVYDLCILIKKQITNISTVNNKTFNVGGGIKNSISLRELTKYCRDITGNKVNIKKKLKTSNYDIRYYISDNKRIKSTYKWNLKKNIKSTLIETMNGLIENKKKLYKIL